MTVASEDQPALTIASLIRNGAKPVLLLGAGASVRSGIPLSEELVNEIAKWGYCRAHARDVDDPTLMRSDWWPWLKKQTWFREEVPLANLYPRAVEAILHPQSDRRAFFQRILKPKIPPSDGYTALAELLGFGVITTVLTTNFDQILANVCRSTHSVYDVTEIRTPDDFSLISSNPQYPQIIYLHGSVDHYTDQNIEAETQKLNPQLVDWLVPLLRDNPVVVIGYRGAEPSVMTHLLTGQAEKCAGYRHGIYWCRRSKDDETPSSLIAALSTKIGGNFRSVSIDGFDEFASALKRETRNSPQGLQSGGIGGSQPKTTVHDLMRSNIDLDAIDLPLLRSKLKTYYEAVRLPQPTLTSRKDVEERMLERRLADSSETNFRPTLGGQLLFVRSKEYQLASASIDVTVEGESSWVRELLGKTVESTDTEENGIVEESFSIEGNLWSQLEITSTFLSRVNRPFRLKGPESKDAYPYPPLALKELLTNLLAHRDYSNSRPSSIKVTKEAIEFFNPGGLIDHVRRQLDNNEMQAVIRSAIRGIKGYRNPVIADFFFSAGAMDKEGSGLPDVVSEASNNGNALDFGPSNDNGAFAAVIQVRPEALTVDRKTRTAKPSHGDLRYSPNLLSINSWPDTIWKISVPNARRGDLRVAREAGAAPFCVADDHVWTFADPSSDASARLIEILMPDTASEVPVANLLDREDAGNVVPRLLNMALEMHLQSIGLLVRFEAGRIRAYFASDGEKPRLITYKGLFKQATRTVAKPVVSRSTGDISFWEHKAVALRFEKFGDHWALSILPSYVFTKNGSDRWIDSERIGPLTTRRAARDYNPSVLHDVVFWSRVLSDDSASSFQVPLRSYLEEGVLIRGTSASVELDSMVPIVVYQDSLGSTGPLDALLVDDEEEYFLQREIEKALLEAEESEINDEA